MPQRKPPAGEGRYSKVVRRGDIPANSTNGRFLAAVRAELTDQLGGEPLTTCQRMLVDRCAFLQLRVALWDETIGVTETTASEIKYYVRLSNSLTRALRLLGLGVKPRPVGRPPKQHQPAPITDILAEANYRETAE